MDNFGAEALAGEVTSGNLSVSIAGYGALCCCYFAFLALTPFALCTEVLSREVTSR